jgi:hypothetical protein
MLHSKQVLTPLMLSPIRHSKKEPARSEKKKPVEAKVEAPPSHEEQSKQIL